MTDYGKRQSIGAIIANSYTLYLDNWLVLCSIAAAYLPLAVLEYALRIVLATHISGSGAAVLFGFLSLVPAYVLIGAVNVVVLDVCLDRKPSVVRAYRLAFRRLPHLLAVNLAAGLLIFIGTFLLVIPGVYLVLRYLFVAPITFAEWLGPSDAMRRSGELARGHYLRNLAACLLCVIAIGIPIALICAVGVFAGGGLGKATGIGAWGVVIAMVVLIVAVTPLPEIPMVLLYFDMRARKDAVDGAVPASGLESAE